MAEEDTPMDDIETAQMEIRSRKYNNMRTEEDENNAISYSPPKHMALNELKKIKESVEKMFLSHEITMQEDFKLEKKQPPPNSLEGRVREIMEKAFWDVLDEELKEEPPNYNHALVLLTEIKNDLLEMLTPTGQSMRSRIEEVLDLELINQKLINNAFDFSPYSEFIIETMSKMCAPLRDENIEQLKKIKNIVPFYQEVFKLLGLMKLDLVNFEIKVVKPLLKQHSSGIERQKFLEILKMQQDNGVDGLMLTKIWLSHSFKYYTQLQLSTPQPSSSLQPSSSQPSSSPQPSSSSPTSSSISRQIKGTIIEAYVCLLYNELTFPETMLMDSARITNIKDSLGCILLVAYIFAVSFVAGARQLDSAFKNKLKAQIFILTQDNVNPKNLSENALALCDQIVSELNKWWVEKGDIVMSSDMEETLRNQIINCTNKSTPVCPVFNILHKRLKIFLRQALTSSKDEFTFPQGFSCLSTELTVVVKSFLSVVTHNQSVFGGIYSDIIGGLIRKQNTGSPSDPTSTSPTTNNTSSTTNNVLPTNDNAATTTSNNNITTSPASNTATLPDSQSD